MFKHFVCWRVEIKTYAKEQHNQETTGQQIRREERERESSKRSKHTTINRQSLETANTNKETHTHTHTNTQQQIINKLTKKTNNIYIYIYIYIYNISKQKTNTAQNNANQNKQHKTKQNNTKTTHNICTHSKRCRREVARDVGRTSPAKEEEGERERGLCLLVFVYFDC